VPWDFVGRDDELDGLLDRFARRTTRGMVLAGPAGVGKTRLATEFLRRVQGPGIATAHITASRSTNRVPFGAVASLLPAGDYPEESVGSRAAMLRSASAALVREAGERRLVLLVDDAHLLDDASATLVYQLITAHAVFVLATVRSGEPAPAAVVGLWKEDLLDRTELPGLGTDAIAELLSAQLGGQVDSAVVSRLAEHCRGNALFLRELVIGAVRDRSLVDDCGIWRLVGPLTPSDRLVELVETRLSDLSREERSLLELVCWGEPLEMTELATIADIAHAELLEERGFLSTRLEGERREVRPAHPVYGDVVRARTPALRVPRLATLLADTVEKRGVKHPRDVLRVATWRLEGGGGSPEIMLAAAQTARWSYEFPLAARLVDRALAVGAGFDAALLAAELATLQGRIAEGQSQLAELATHAHADREKALIVLARLNNHAFYGGAMDEGLRIVREAEQTIRSRDWRDEIAARRSGLLLAKSGPWRAAEAFEPLLTGDNDRALVWANQIAAPSYARIGRFSASLDAADRGYAIARSLSRPTEWYPWVHLFFRCQTLALSGRFGEAETLAKREHAAALEHGSIEAQAWFAWGVALSLRERGGVTSAIRYCREAAALFHELGRSLVEREALMDLAFALASAGQSDEARTAVAALDDLGVPTTYLTGMDLAITRGWVEAACGDLHRAHDHFTDAVETGERIGDLVGAVNALHGLARLGRGDRGHAERLDRLAEAIEGDLVGARAEHTRGLVEGDVGLLEMAAAGFEALGADVLAAEAAADAAAVAQNGRDRRRAAANEFRAGVLLDRCEGAVLLGSRSRSARGVLTRAEQEAALLAAAGRTNRSIADELCLSVRTVEGRLQRVYTKLGVTSREELGAKLSAARVSATRHPV
jgi:DNA-binding CsgD family transcriptional regulator